MSRIVIARTYLRRIGVVGSRLNERDLVINPPDIHLERREVFESYRPLAHDLVDVVGVDQRLPFVERCVSRKLDNRVPSVICLDKMTLQDEINQRSNSEAGGSKGQGMRERGKRMQGIGKKRAQ